MAVNIDANVRPRSPQHTISSIGSIRRSQRCHSRIVQRKPLQAISQKSDGNVTLHPGSKVYFHFQIQLDTDLQRRVFLLGLALVVQVGALLHHLADLVRGHVLDFLV